MHPTHPTPATAEPTPADILRGAARYIQRYGWHRGDFYAQTCAPFPPACAVGAIRVAVCGEPKHGSHPYRVTDSESTAIHEAQDVFAAYLTHGFSPWENPAVEVIGDWNDRNVADEVIAALTNAAHEWDVTHGGAR